ncbi:LysR family transcriptional regulator [Azospira restricta]|uniref:LysR family transcriptional regulator n=1 Tax=Azospira restricta TaxID=404405 RepID=A0A974SPB3_9RHOO|nr:LysR family transcriptional regulator [Azospira restricta]QRJ63939.1 LysR family transcriptional regulator [Azospira restricta]
MDRLESMQMFRRVAEMGSFSAVARQLDVARSVVTRQVAALEAHLGVKLIARSTRRLNLTAAGLAYLEKCREILSLVEAAESDLAAEGQVPRGHIRISVPFSFGLRHLTPLLLDFGTLYPEITLEVDYTDRRVNLIEEGIDLAIRITRRLAPQDVARRISVCRMLVVAADDYLRRRGEPRRPEELIDHECFGYVPAAPSSWPFVVDGETRAFPIRSRLLANNGDALLDAAIRGLGITSAPSFIAAAAVEAGSVRPILTDYAQPELGIYAVFPGNRYVPRRVRVLVDYLAERIGPEPYWDALPLFRTAPQATLLGGGGRRARGR